MSEPDGELVAELHVASDKPITNSLIENIDKTIPRQSLVGIVVTEKYGSGGECYMATEAAGSDLASWGDTPAEAVEELAATIAEQEGEQP
jgi:hypothetical protein